MAEDRPVWAGSAAAEKEGGFMSFVPVKSEHGAAPPWEYLPAKAGTYACGQMLEVREGLLNALAGAASGTPPYLCMADMAFTVDEELLPVIRVSQAAVYETSLSEDGSVKIGSKLGVAPGGLNAGGSGNFEIVSLEGNLKGDLVRGRFV